MSVEQLMRKLVISILLGLTAFGHATAQEVVRTNRVATAFQPSKTSSDSITQLTVKVAYYRCNHDRLVSATEAQLSTNLLANGIVLSVLEPAQFKGKVVTFHFDFPEEWDHWYLPDFIYRGQVRTESIGRTNFPCDPGCFAPVALPLPSSDPDSLKRPLQNNVWGEHFAAAIKNQFGDKVLFDMLYSFLTDTNQSPSQFADQKAAAKLLVHVRPACGMSPTRAIEETFSTWNASVGDWPLYLWRSFGHDDVLRALDEVDLSKLSVTEQEKMEVWRYWLSGEEKDLAEER